MQSFINVCELAVFLAIIQAALILLHTMWSIARLSASIFTIKIIRLFHIGNIASLPPGIGVDDDEEPRQPIGFKSGIFGGVW